jgi:hypothetical protein
MAVLRKLFSDAPNPVSYYVTRWASDPFAYGSYSFLPRGAEPRDRTRCASVGPPAADVLRCAGSGAQAAAGPLQCELGGGRAPDVPGRGGGSAAQSSCNRFSKPRGWQWGHHALNGACMRPTNLHRCRDNAMANSLVVP